MSDTPLNQVPIPQGTQSVDEMRDALLAAAPQHADTILDRAAVVEQWCRENGVDKDQITAPQLLEIRALPAWQNAGR